MADVLDDLFAGIGSEILLQLLQKSVRFEGRIGGIRHWQGSGAEKMRREVEENGEQTKL